MLPEPVTLLQIFFVCFYFWFISVSEKSWALKSFFWNLRSRSGLHWGDTWKHFKCLILQFIGEQGQLISHFLPEIWLDGCLHCPCSEKFELLFTVFLFPSMHWEELWAFCPALHWLYIQRFSLWFGRWLKQTFITFFFFAVAALKWWWGHVRDAELNFLHLENHPVAVSCLTSWFSDWFSASSLSVCYCVLLFWSTSFQLGVKVELLTGRRGQEELQQSDHSLCLCLRLCTWISQSQSSAVVSLQLLVVTVIWNISRIYFHE